MRIQTTEWIRNMEKTKNKKVGHIHPIVPQRINRNRNY